MASLERRSSLWAVVLAAGEGRRLVSLTRALYGQELPKQFAEIEPGRTMLQATLDRIAPLVPLSRTVVVVDETQVGHARSQLARYPGVDLALQPKNLDTGPGILFPLARILARDPLATVAIFPSDHDVPRRDPFLDAAERAASPSPGTRDRITLLGVVPDDVEGEYGWIVPGRPIDGVLRGVSRFVEKPPAPVAAALFADGALWNTFVSAARLETYLALAASALPAATALFRQYSGAVGTAGERFVLRAIYDRLAPANFSRAVLERARGLAVLPVEGSGWSDWGSPERVLRSLEQRGQAESLRARLAGAVASASA